MKNNTALSKASNHNFSVWVFEKTRSALSQLCQVYNKVTDEQIKYSISIAINDLFKIYIYWIGDLNLYNNENLSLIKSIDGLNSFDIKIGLREDFHKYIYESIYQFLSSSISRRTEMHEYLVGYNKSDLKIEQLKDDLEKVTMGEISWEELCETHRDNFIV